MLVTAERAFRPDHSIGPYWMRIQGDRITQTGAELAHVPSAQPQERLLHCGPHQLLTPGLLDIHCHGGGGASFSEGSQAAREVLVTHRAAGTTTMLASLVAAPLDQLITQTRALARLVADPASGLAGVHWEGPWLSELRRGAHIREHLVDPNAAGVQALLDSAVVSMVTLAPEREGALEVVRQLSEAGVVVALGHTDAPAELVEAGIAAGARAGTHLLNAMSGLDHRHPGAAAALLADDSVALELICDGVHVHPAMIRLVFSWGHQRVVLVSDAMAAAGQGNGDFRLGDALVRVSGGAARILEPVGSTGAIAGSTLSVSAALRYAVTEAGVPLEWAMAAATTNPARLLGLPQLGTLTEGAQADAVIFTPELEVEQVLYRGVWI